MATQPLATTSEDKGLVAPIGPDTRRRRPFLRSSIGTKVLIAVTGLLMVVYLILHLFGNLLFFAGPATFNGYSRFLISNPLIYPIEVGLLLIVLTHTYKAVANWAANRAARPVNYYNAQKRVFGYGWAGPPSRKTIASSTMIVTGLFTLVFIVIHVRQFRLGAEYMTQVGGQAARDLYRVEVENFSSPLNVLFYLVAVALVSTHLWHGISSAFNSLGVDHYRYTPTILKAGRLLSGILAVGFIFIVLWVFLTRGVR